MKILDLDLDLAFEITRDFRLNNFDHYIVVTHLKFKGGTLNAKNTNRWQQ